MDNYLVFARPEYEEPLEYQGTLAEESGKDVQALAVERFGERWVELVLIPEARVHWVMREEAEVESPA